MFTGLVEDLGQITAMNPRGSGVQLAVRTAIPLGEVAIGDSIAVDGACLTAETLVGDVFTAIAAKETLDKTTLGRAVVGRKVHLERAMRLGDRMGGHIVQGHVDGVGTVVRATQERESRVIWVEVHPELSRYIAAKGSVTVDGVSMTVNELSGSKLRINAVPHTQGVTKMGGLATGDRVNVEVDILAKYVERLLAPGAGQAGLTMDHLQKHGFTS